MTSRQRVSFGEIRSTTGNTTSKTGYKWWIERIRTASELYDIVRIDHFRGFESYYTIPFGNEDATVGEWKKGPNYELSALQRKTRQAEHNRRGSGFITPEVREMLDKCGYPGMKVLQFGFSDGKNEHLPHNFASSNCFAYTGTHDNETLIGWIESLDKKSLKFTKNYLNVKKKKDIPDAVVRAAWGSVAAVAVAQIQDFLGSDMWQNEHPLNSRLQLAVPHPRERLYPRTRKEDTQA